MSLTKYDKIKIKQYKPDWAECPQCKISFNLKDRSSWSGLIHRACGQRLEIIDYKNDIDFVWGIKANVVIEGATRFAGDTSVYLFPPLWSDGYKFIKVIGKDKETKKFIEIIISSNALLNFKTVKITKPDVISRISTHWSASQESKDLADQLVITLKQRQEGIAE